MAEEKGGAPIDLEALRRELDRIRRVEGEASDLFLERVLSLEEYGEIIAHLKRDLRALSPAMEAIELAIDTSPEGEIARRGRVEYERYLARERAGIRHPHQGRRKGDSNGRGARRGGKK